MFSQISIASLVAALAVFDSAAALGINCRGSGLCPRASWDNQGAGSVMQGLRDAMYSATNVPASTQYNAGDHIICVSQSQKITLTPGISAGGSVGGNGSPTGTASASMSVGLSGSIGNGGVCVFAQNSGVTLGQARTLMDGLLQHGCTTCGSNPINPGNNVDSGEVTVNYVANPFCIGNCISSSATGTPAGGENPTAGKSSKRDEDSTRWGKRGERLRLE